MIPIRHALTVAASLAASASTRAQVSYTTTWVGNTFGDNAHHVGNAARSMWVAPEGVVYTASAWDENEGSIAIYQNGHSIGAIGTHGGTHGGSIAGNTTYLFAELPFSTAYGGSGYVGRYVRSTGAQDKIISVSADTTERHADVVTGLAVSGNGLLYASDFPGNRVRVFTTDGVWQQDWNITGPGRIAIDGAGNVWVAQMGLGTIQEFSPSGSALSTINMGATSRPSALCYDAANNQLMVGDQGPNMDIQIYGNLSGTPTLAGTFGVQGGYLDTTTGVKGQTGDKRFTRVVGIGKDSAGNLYVLNNPWGGSWDLGRNGETDLHCYDGSGTLQWTLQGLNFEAVAAADPGTDGAYLYSGNNIYTGSAGGGYVANSIDAITYPNDPRLNLSDPGRGEHFGQLATVSGHRILVACGQNPDIFYFSYFNSTSGYTSIPLDSLPGTTFNTTARVRSGFWIDSKGDLWVGLDKTNAIWHYPLTGFDASGKPLWGAPTSVPTPSSIAPLGRLLYLPATDTMILANATSTDWTALGGTVQVYKGWIAGNTTTPNLTINLNTANNPKTLAAAGNYLFVAYVHTIPNIDAYNLTTGSLDLSMTSSDPNVYVGNDVDSMYGLRAYQASNGNYIVTKDNYNGSSVIIHTMTSGANPPPAAPTGLTASGGNAQASLTWNSSSGATSYDVYRGTTGGGPYSLVATGVSPTSYTDTGVSNGTTYYYVVTAVNSYGQSGYSNEASATPGAIPTAPTNLAATAGNAQVSLGWTASSGATSYDVYRGTASGGPYSLVTTGISATSYTDTGVSDGTTYYYVVTAVNGTGQSGYSNEASATPSASILPSPWLTQDIGAVGIAGSASYSAGTFTISGSGGSISGTSDQFRFVYQSAGTSNTITARVVSMTNTNSGAQAGVMVRETLTTGSTMANVNLTPSNGVTWLFRATTGGSTSGSRSPGLVAPYWVRVVRNGSTLTGYWSPDGVTWTQQGTTTISMAGSVYIGLVVSSRNNSALCTATFDNVSVTSP